MDRHEDTPLNPTQRDHGGKEQTEAQERMQELGARNPFSIRRGSTHGGSILVERDAALFLRLAIRRGAGGHFLFFEKEFCSLFDICFCRSLLIVLLKNLACR